MTTFLGEAYLASGELDRAEDFARQGLELTRSAEYWCGVGVAQRALGRIARARADPARAAADLGQALDTFAACDALYYAGRTRLDLAGLAGARGERQHAAAHLAEAHRLFRTLRVPKYLERARGLAAELGVALETA